MFGGNTAPVNFERAIPLLAPRGRMIVMAGRDARQPSVGPFYVRTARCMVLLFNATPANSERRPKILTSGSWKELSNLESIESSRYLTPPKRTACRRTALLKAASCQVRLF